MTIFTCLEGSAIDQISFNETIKNGRMHKSENGSYEYFDIEPNTNININTITFSVEIKEHSEDKIRVNGTDLEVYYSKDKKWRAATSKLIGQAMTAKSFLSDQIKTNPYRVASFIYLPNVKKVDLAPKIAGRDLSRSILYADSTFRDLIRLYIATECAYRKGRYLSIGQKDITGHRVRQRVEHYYNNFKPGKLEQEKLELMAKKYIDERYTKWNREIGKKLVAFWGKAGTGKTLKLLRTANDLLVQNYDTTLILTFNRALARDLERLLKLHHIQEGHRGQI